MSFYKTTCPYCQKNGVKSWGIPATFKEIEKNGVKSWGIPATFKEIELINKALAK
jgi:hypothetical protein